MFRSSATRSTLRLAAAGTTSSASSIDQAIQTARTITMTHVKPETIMRDLLLKEVRGGVSQTEIPLLVSAAETYARVDPLASTMSTASPPPDLLKLKQSTMAPLYTHSYRKISFYVPPPPIPMQSPSSSTTSSSSSSSSIAVVGDEGGKQKQQQSHSKNHDSTSFVLLNRLKESSPVSASTFGGQVTAHKSTSGRLIFSKMSPNESMLIRDNVRPDQFRNEYEKKIYDIIFCPENEKVESYLLAEKILDDVVLPLIHGNGAAINKNEDNRSSSNPILEERIRKRKEKQTASASASSTTSTATKPILPLSVSLKELLLFTNYHKYASCLGSHLLLERDLCLSGDASKSPHKKRVVFYNTIDDKNGTTAMTQSEADEVALVKPGWIVSLRAQSWIDWMDSNQSTSVAELLFGSSCSDSTKRASTAAKATNRLLLLQPSLYRALNINPTSNSENEEYVSKFRYDLFELGYDLSEDLTTIVKR